MAGTFYEYFDGYIRVSFAMAGYGDIYIDFALHGDAIATTPCDENFVKGTPDISLKNDATVRTWTSASMSYFFRDMFCWLESIVCGVQECAYEWDGEGPMGELRWFNRFDGSGRLKLSWSGNRNSPNAEHELRVSKVQLVRAFYESFRHFVESDRYDPLDYERLDAGEVFVLVLEDGDLDALADHLATLERDAAESFIDAMLELAGDRNAGYPRRDSIAAFTERATGREIDGPEERRWVPVEWTSWDFAQRRHYVVERIYKGGTLIGDGEKLRELRSPMVEKWLADQGQAAPQRAEQSN